MQRDASLLLDMLRAARQIVQFMENMDFEQFRADSKTQSAVIHQFLLIGEVKKAHPAMRWSAMARMRDKLIHHYRGVDLKEIYKAADTEIPKLVEFLRSHVPEDL